MSKDRREDIADWLIVAGSVALFGSLFLTWSHQFGKGFVTEFGASELLRGVPRDPSAWQVYSAMDVVLALLAAGLLAVALIGNRPARLIALAGAAVALAFSLHARSHPPTNGVNVYNPTLRVREYVHNPAVAGPGETVAIAALAVAIAGLGLSFTAD